MTTIAQQLEQLEQKMRLWIEEPFVNLTPMREMDFQQFIDRLAAIRAAAGGEGVASKPAMYVSARQLDGVKTALDGRVGRSVKASRQHTMNRRIPLYAPAASIDIAPETKHSRDCEYVTSDGPAPCTCVAGREFEEESLYASPPATVDVVALSGLATQWRHNAQGCGRNDAHAAGTWRSCARELAALIAEAANAPSAGSIGEKA